jgi:hypothetical protein
LANSSITKRRGRRKGQCVGVYSCNTTLANLDKRSWYGRLIRQVRQDLTDHIGGNPTPVQRMLIERASMLQLRVAMLDQKIIDGEILTVMDNNQYLAWSNSLVRTLAQLGLDATTTPQPIFSDILRDIAARRHSQPEDEEAA